MMWDGDILNVDKGCNFYPAVLKAAAKNMQDICFFNPIAKVLRMPRRRGGKGFFHEIRDKGRIVSYSYMLP